MCLSVHASENETDYDYPSEDYEIQEILFDFEPIQTIEALGEVHLEVSNNQMRIVRTYKLTDGANSLLPTDAFSFGGQDFIFYGIQRQEAEDLTKRDHIKQVSVETRTSDINTIMSELQPRRWYSSNDGFIGYLTLNHETITTNPMPYRRGSRSITDTRNYTNLAFGDIGQIARSITRNGVELILVDVNWTSNTAPVDFTQVATTYNAVAHYRGYYSISYIPGFITTAYFEGEIENPSLQPDIIYEVHFVSIPTVHEMQEPEFINQVVENIISQEIVEQDESEIVTKESENSGRFLALIITMVFLAIMSAGTFIGYRKGLFKNIQLPQLKSKIQDEDNDEFE